MNVWSTGVSPLAHGVHYGVLVVGLLGLLALLGPRWVGAPRTHAPRDEHEQRVTELHRQIASGSLGTAVLAAPAPAYPAPRPAPLLVPLVVVSSTAAAGVHAALGPLHYAALPLFGVFFTLTAIAQLAWSLALVLRPGRQLLVLGMVGNAVLLALWVLTRTVGLPFGLLPDPEPVGLWDLTCAGWEVAVVLGLHRLLREDRGPRTTFPAYPEWPSAARLWLFGSVLVLAALTLLGGGA